MLSYFRIQRPIQKVLIFPNGYQRCKVFKVFNVFPFWFCFLFYQIVCYCSKMSARIAIGICSNYTKLVNKLFFLYSVKVLSSDAPRDKIKIIQNNNDYFMRRSLTVFLKKFPFKVVVETVTISVWTNHTHTTFFPFLVRNIYSKLFIDLWSIVYEHHRSRQQLKPNWTSMQAFHKHIPRVRYVPNMDTHNQQPTTNNHNQGALNPNTILTIFTIFTISISRLYILNKT